MDRPEQQAKRLASNFYGWRLVVVGWLLYGFGVAPAFYSWSFFLREVIEELGISRAQAGLIFGAYTLCGGIASPFVGMALTRFGLRKVYTAGSLVSAVGFFLTSRAETVLEFYLYFALLTGFSHAFATILPAQTLASNWFLRYRSRVMAILLTAGGIVAPLVLAFDAWLLSHTSWRTGWVVIAGLTLVLALLAAVFVRDTPEAMGQRRDGAESDEPQAPKVVGQPQAADDWTAREALRTPQFFLMVICGLGYAVPWGVVNTHSRLHLQDLGFEMVAVAAIVSWMALFSTLGRGSGALGDFVSPPKLLGFALALEALGSGLFLVARTPPLAYLSVFCLGVGFGMAYISQATTFSLFFGRKAFATTTGTRFLIGALFNAAAPGLAGWVHDTTGAYTAAFLGLAVLGAVAAAVAFLLRPPRRAALAAA